MYDPQWPEGPPRDVAISMFEGLIGQIEKGIIEGYKNKLNYKFEQLMNDPGLVLPFLRHADSDHRSLALTFAAWHWPDSEPRDVIAILSAAAFDDPDERVRGLAATLLGGKAGGAGGSEVMRTLLHVLEIDKSNSVKCNAYLSIIGPKHRDYSKFLGRDEQHRFDSSKEVDWDGLMASLEKE